MCSSEASRHSVCFLVERSPSGHLPRLCSLNNLSCQVKEVLLFFFRVLKGPLLYSPKPYRTQQTNFGNAEIHILVPNILESLCVCWVSPETSPHLSGHRAGHCRSHTTLPPTDRSSCVLVDPLLGLARSCPTLEPFVHRSHGWIDFLSSSCPSPDRYCSLQLDAGSSSASWPSVIAKCN